MLGNTLKHILNNTNNKYRTTVAAQKVFQKLALNSASLTQKERREKIAIVALNHVFEGKSKIIEQIDDADRKDAEKKDAEKKEAESK